MRALGADEQLTKNVSWFLVNAFSDQATVTTAEIANAICAALNRAGRTDLATAFTEHRRQDDASFDKATDPQQKLNQLFDENSRVVHENANKDSKVFNTQRDLEAGVVSRALGLKMMPEVVAKAHLRGDIHWHDLDYSPVTPETNCCLIDFDEMLANGFKIGNAWVDSPKSIQTATAQMSQIIANVASFAVRGLFGQPDRPIVGTLRDEELPKAPGRRQAVGGRRQARRIRQDQD